MSRLPGDPGALGWLRFTYGFRLPAENVHWVRHELTDAGWRDGLRAIGALPNVAVGNESLTTTGLVTLAAALVVTLLFAILGGKAGDLFHRRVDRFAARDYVETA